MQQEIETYENEIKELKKKIPKRPPYAKPLGADPIRGSSPINNSPNQSNSPGILSNVDSSVFAQEIKLVKTMNKMLEKSNVELKNNLTEALMSKLPPLPKLVKQSAILNKDENFVKLTKESNELMKNLYSSLAGIKVTELKPEGSVTYKAQNNVEFKYYLKSARKVNIFERFFLFCIKLIVINSFVSDTRKS